MHTVTGTFDIKLTPSPVKEGARIARMSFSKEFQGQMRGSSSGEMLAVGTSTSEAGAYVAIEWVIASLDGKQGSFALHHNGTKQHGQSRMDIAVVPDSGSADLTGIAGQFEIRIEGGKHYYRFDYTLPETR
ncbi:DUF3224 domain-containing protein [Chitinimonas sp.]|uniref:DUF3224 domain-containing protein n=1 Tax=Chitinimonas sp. TaxID=1934313 RepID=UPI0035B42A8E